MHFLLSVFAELQLFPSASEGTLGAIDTMHKCIALSFSADPGVR
jgi:hypothetical protein